MGQGIELMSFTTIRVPFWNKTNCRLAAGLGFSEHMERAESTQFCLSCRVMLDFGQSLYVDDPSYIPARHFQNNLVPRERACCTCHTDYAIFGTVHAKRAACAICMSSISARPRSRKR
jgi:hypothetical protein